MTELTRLMDNLENPGSQNNTFGNLTNNSLNGTGMPRRPINN